MRASQTLMSRRQLLCATVGAAALVTTLTPAGLLQAAEKAADEFPRDYFFNEPSDPDQQKLNTLVGKKMPELAVSDWHTGEVKPTDLKGKVVIVDLWATWCGPCVAAIPHNNELTEKYKDKGLVIVGVCTSRNGQDKLPQAIEKYKIAYPVCKDPDLKTEKAYKIAFYPTYVAIDRKGIVRAIGLRPDHVEDVVKKLLEENAA
jgi:thiol-disulfide isomerase/thioredoxin